MLNNPPRKREEEQTNHTHCWLFERLFRDAKGEPISITVNCACGSREDFKLVKK